MPGRGKHNYEKLTTKASLKLVGLLAVVSVKKLYSRELLFLFAGKRKV